MNLYEFQAKNTLNLYVPFPKGEFTSNPEEAYEIARRLEPPVVIKPQGPFGGRGKLGKIYFADTLDEAKKFARRLLREKIKGKKVYGVLVEKKIVDIKRELYFAIKVNRSKRCYAAIASRKGGIDIEDVPPEEAMEMLTDPLFGFHQYDAIEIAKWLGYSGKQMRDLANIFVDVYHEVRKYNALLIDINPLAETYDEKFIALDARLTVDGNAIRKHDDFKAIKEGRLEKVELKAYESRLGYVKLDGNLGIIGNGAGLVMFWVDWVKRLATKYGLMDKVGPADFLDVGGGADIGRMEVALDILLEDPTVEVAAILMFTGVTRFDEMAKAIANKKKKIDESNKPLFVAADGNKAKEGAQILQDSGIEASTDLFGTLEKAVRRAGGLE